MAASIFSLFGEIFVENKDAIDKLTTTDKKGSDVAKKLGSAFKTAGEVVAGAAAAVAGVVTATVEAAKETAAAGDRIDKMSQKLGMSREGFQKWEFVLSQNGATIESMSGGMKKLTNSIDDLASGSKTATETFDRLGLSYEDVAGMTQEDAFALVVERLQQIEDPVERAAIANDLLGKSAQELAPLLNQTAEATAALMEQTEEYGMIMTDDAVNASTAWTDSLDKLTRSINGFKNNMMSKFLPAMTKVTDGLALLLNGDTSGIDAISEGFKGFLDVFAEIIPGLVELGGSMIKTLAQAVIDNLPELATTAFEIIGQLVSFIIENLPTIIEAGMTILMQLMSGIAQALPTMIPTIITVVLTIVDNIISNADMLIDGAIALIIGLAEGLINAIPILLEKAPEIIAKLVEAIVENVPKIIEAAGQIIIMLAKGIVDNFPLLVNAAGEIINTIINGVSKLWTKIKKLGKDVINKLWDGLKEAWENVKSWFNNVWNKLFNKEAKVKLETEGNGSGHMGGLDYVPYDGYQAVLHKGERVLTAAQVRQGVNGSGEGVTIVQNISAVAQTPVELAAATNAYFTQARWAI